MMMKRSLLASLVLFTSLGKVLANGCGLKIGQEKNGNNGNKKKYQVPGILPKGCDKGSKIEIELPDGMVKKFKGNKKNGNRPSWAGQSGFASLEFIRSSLNDDLIVGSMVDAEEGMVYQFMVNADGEEEVTVTPSSDFPPEEDPEDFDVRHRQLLVEGQGYQELMDEGFSGSIEQQGLRGRGGFLDKAVSEQVFGTSLFEENHHERRLLDDGSVVDIMVVWTKGAECETAGYTTTDCTTTSTTEFIMRDLVDLAVEETNTALTASGVNFQLRLVHAYRDEDYIETSDFGVSLNDLTFVNDGKLDSVHAKREEFRADVVAMLRTSGGSCGIAWRSATPSKSYMFSVTAWSCATGQWGDVGLLKLLPP